MSTEPEQIDAIEPQQKPIIVKKTRGIILALLLLLIACTLALSIYNQQTIKVINNDILLQDKSLQTTTIAIDSLKNNFQQFKRNSHTQDQELFSEISYLIHMANYQLIINHDVSLALKTLTVAESEISSQNTNAFNDIKNSLTSTIKQLRTIPVLDTQALFSTINHLNDQIQSLSPLPMKPDISLQHTIDSVKSTNPVKPWYLQVWNNLKHVKDLFIIRHLDETNTLAISPETELAVKQTIAMQLALAQWGLIHRNHLIFEQALQNVIHTMKQYFAFSNVSSLLDQLNTLQKTDIQPPLPALNDLLRSLSNFKMDTTSESLPQIEPGKPRLPVTPKLQGKVVPEKSVSSPNNSPTSPTGIET